MSSNNFVNVTGDENCSPSGGEKGITIWGPYTFQLSKNGGNYGPLYFTLTDPRCYQGGSGAGTQLCNVTYKIRTSAQSQNKDVGPIWMAVNQTPQSGQSYDCPNNPYLAYSPPRYHSSSAGNDIIETIDLAPANVLNEFGANYLYFTNCSDVDVTVENLTIIRAYQMQNLSTDLNNGCTDNGTNYAAQPDFTQRVDYVCNYENCGGASLTSFGPNNYWNVVSPGQTVTWNWTNPANPQNNYLGPISCLFNFNNVVLNVLPDSQGNGPYATSGSEKFSIKVNNSNWVDFYQTEVAGHHTAPSVDLVQVFPGSNGYNDAPGAGNSLQLMLDSGATYALALCDGCPQGCNSPPNCNCGMPDCCPNLLANNCCTCDTGQGQGGNINIYRVYQTKDVYPITISYSSGGCIFDSNNNPVTSGQRIGVNAGDTPMYTIMPNSGWQCTGLQLNGTPITPVTYYTFAPIEAPQNLYASFSQIPTGCSVTLSYDSSRGSVSSSSCTCDSNVTITATAYAGYMLDHWLIDPNDNGGDWVTGQENPLVFAMAGQNHTVNAYFEPTYPIYTNVVSGSGSITGQSPAEQGSTPTFTITAGTGYYISDIQDNGGEVSFPFGSDTYAYTLQPITQAHTISVTFTQTTTLIIAALDTYWGYTAVYPNVYVDGTLYPWGQDGYVTVQQLTQSNHSVQVDASTFDSAWNTYCYLQYMIDGNNNYYYTDPASVPVSSTTYLTVYYHP